VKKYLIACIFAWGGGRIFHLGADTALALCNHPLKIHICRCLDAQTSCKIKKAGYLINKQLLSSTYLLRLIGTGGRTQGSTKADYLQGNRKEDDAQNTNDKINSPTSHNPILPRMVRSITQAAADSFDLGIVHDLFAVKEAKSNDAMDPEVRINAIKKKVRKLFNRGTFFSRARRRSTSTCLYYRYANHHSPQTLLHNRRGGKSSLDTPGMRREGPDCLQCSAFISCLHPHPHQLRCNK
jgi:hypothetical protein